MRFAFGDGVALTSSEFENTRRGAQSDRRKNSTLARSSMYAVEQVVRVGNTQHSSGAPLKLRNTIGSRKRTRSTSEDDDDDDDDLYIDLDVPSDDLFSNEFESNTFGQGQDIASRLVRLYAQAYATMNLLLFSYERTAIEAKTRRMVENDAIHRIGSYMNEQVKHAEPFVFTKARQLESRALNIRRLYPDLILPPNGSCRLKAYYSMVAMEFFLQISHVMVYLKDTFDGAMRTTVERFQQQAFASVAPNIFDLMREGLLINGITIIEKELLLEMFPESNTMHQLGIETKMCTDVKKMLKQCAWYASSCNVALEKFQTTYLDSIDFLFGGESVVVKFLDARRVRLKLDFN